MILRPTPVAGAWELTIEPHHDERGFFARTWCAREFEAKGLNPSLAQCSVSFNAKAGTLRGLHFQRSPWRETKLVRCTAGAVFDAIVDLRPESSTYLKTHTAILSAANRVMLYVPEGCAHGFQTETDDAEVFYQISEFHHPEAGDGVRWDDPAFGIRWPDRRRIIADRDRGYPDYARVAR